jgi:murein DD-endopeptidase MepM/ murein hydrolase activator NlpD
MSPQDAIALAGAFSPLADLSRCRPGEVFTLERKPGGAVSSVTYKKGPLMIYEARADDRGWEAVEKFVPYVMRTERITGVVDTSLFEALNLQGEKDFLALSLLDILAWEIDFTHDARKGDRFNIFVEKYYVDGRFVEYGPILAASYTTAERRIDAYSLENDRGLMDYFDEKGRSLKKSFLKSPLRYNRITSSYTGRRLHPITRRVQPHYAIDYAAPQGTPVWAVANGTIRSMSYDRANGRMVRISHPGGYETFYLHLSRYARGLKRGKKVAQKQIIGYVGSTGMATGPHLDYRLKKRGRYTNPLKEDFPRADPVTKSRREEFFQRVAWLGSVLEDNLSGQMAQASPQTQPSRN